MKKALITGITGQDGSYLTEFLLEKGYKVFGVIRRKSTLDYGNIEHIKDKITIHFGDLTDYGSIYSIIKEVNPNEIYNLAAQSFVGVSWDQPSLTTQVNSLGVLNILESIRYINKNIKFYQASTSEMFGLVQETPQSEKTPFYPRSPYGVSKLYAHWLTINYRESYNIFACSGILFNHESERRGHEFVTRKVTDGVAKIVLNKLDYIELGNLSSKRDWGHAKDYVEAMWLMLQNDVPSDYVIASNETHTIKHLVETAFKSVGINIKWIGHGINEVGINVKNGKTLVKVNPKFYRKTEVDLLLGNSNKAEKELKWKRKISFQEMIRNMVQNDINLNRD